MAVIRFAEVPQFYHTYLAYIHDQNLAEAFEQHVKELTCFLQAMPPDKWSYRYTPDKWSIKEVVQHLIDAERIFCYRALVFARKDETALSGFDENSYAANSNADARTPQSLMEELALVQKSSQLLFRHFDAAALAASGIANGNRIYAEAIGFVIIGHARHHLRIVKERYF